VKWWRRLVRGPRYHRLLDELTDALQKGENERAAETAEQCVAAAESIYGAEDPELVGPLYALASANLALGRHEEAAVASERALALGADAGRGCVPPLHQLWEQRAAIADLASDEEGLLRALRAMRDVADDDPLVRATAHNRLGLWFGRAGRFDEAAEELERALDLRERALGGSLAVAEVLHNVATFRDPASDAAGSLDKAAEAFARALEIVSKHLTREASVLEARIAHNFAVLRQEQLQDDEAEVLYRHSLAAWERDHEATDPALRPTLARLGRLLQATRRFDGAVPLLERALAIAEIELGADHEITEKLAIWLGDANSSTYR
jgi:tetratricopeptide (TPR) repeat protein